MWTAPKQYGALNEIILATCILYTCMIIINTIEAKLNTAFNTPIKAKYKKLSVCLKFKFHGYIKIYVSFPICGS